MSQSKRFNIGRHFYFLEMQECIFINIETKNYPDNINMLFCVEVVLVYFLSSKPLENYYLSNVALYDFPKLLLVQKKYTELKYTF
jgi:hypothetical protein